MLTASLPTKHHNWFCVAMVPAMSLCSIVSFSCIFYNSSQMLSDREIEKSPSGVLTKPEWTHTFPLLCPVPTTLTWMAFDLRYGSDAYVGSEERPHLTLLAAQNLKSQRTGVTAQPNQNCQRHLHIAAPQAAAPGPHYPEPPHVHMWWICPVVPTHHTGVVRLAPRFKASLLPSP